VPVVNRTDRELAVYDPKDLAKAPEPWLQQLNEPDEAFRFFRAYRELSWPRRLQRLHGKDTAQIAKWSSEHKWVQRCEAYDRMLEEHAVEIKKETVGKLMRESAAHSVATINEGFQVVRREIQLMLEKANDPQWEKMPIMQEKNVIKLAELLMKFTNLIAGLPTERVENQTSVDYSKMSTEDLKIIMEIEAKNK